MTRMVRPGGTQQVLAASKDGRLLAAASDDGHAHLWDITDPHHPHPLASLDRSRQTTWSLAFSPNGHIPAAANGDVISEEE